MAEYNESGLGAFKGQTQPRKPFEVLVVTNAIVAVAVRRIRLALDIFVCCDGSAGRKIKCDVSRGWLLWRSFQLSF
jgi:hypothetical protein